ncbi:MAG: hypothetical protein R3F61_08795 [Myxococcota bacterium]
MSRGLGWNRVRALGVLSFVVGAVSAPAIGIPAMAAFRYAQEAGAWDWTWWAWVAVGELGSIGALFAGLAMAVGRRSLVPVLVVVLAACGAFWATQWAPWTNGSRALLARMTPWFPRDGVFVDLDCAGDACWAIDADGRMLRITKQVQLGAPGFFQDRDVLALAPVDGPPVQKLRALVGDRTCTLSSGTLTCTGPAGTWESTSVRDFEVGGERLVALHLDGRVTSWRPGLEEARGLALDADQVVASTRSACARLKTGRVACWGDEPRREIPDVTGVTRLYQGNGLTCAETPSELVCWGDWSDTDRPGTPTNEVRRFPAPEGPLGCAVDGMAPACRISPGPPPIPAIGPLVGAGRTGDLACYASAEVVVCATGLASGVLWGEPADWFRIPSARPWTPMLALGLGPAALAGGPDVPALPPEANGWTLHEGDRSIVHPSAPADATPGPIQVPAPVPPDAENRPEIEESDRWEHDGVAIVRHHTHDETGWWRHLQLFPAGGGPPVDLPQQLPCTRPEDAVFSPLYSGPSTAPHRDRLRFAAIGRDEAGAFEVCHFDARGALEVRYRLAPVVAWAPVLIGHPDDSEALILYDTKRCRLHTFRPSGGPTWSVQLPSVPFAPCDGLAAGGFAVPPR